MHLLIIYKGVKEMDEFDIKLNSIRGELNKATRELSVLALEDSKTYEEAIQKLKDYRWKLSGSFSNEIIKKAIDHIKDYALGKEIEKPLD